jgi:hypothetical protein
LYSVYYKQKAGPLGNSYSENICGLGSPSVDLAFEDTTLENVEDAWRAVMGLSAGDQPQADLSETYMRFEDRDPMGEEEEYYGV